MEPTKSRTKHLPTLALILSLTPVTLTVILIALGSRGNWGFLILGGITYFVSQLVCGAASLALGIVCIRKKWGRGRAITAVVLSSLGLLISIAAAGSFFLRGLLI